MCRSTHYAEFYLWIPVQNSFTTLPDVDSVSNGPGGNFDCRREFGSDQRNEHEEDASDVSQA